MNQETRDHKGPLAPLGNPVYRAIWITSLASNFGGMIQSVAASWTMTAISTPQMVALVTTSVTLPILLLSLVAGALADTFDRRAMMLIAQAFMLLVSLALALFAYAGWLTPWLLLAFTFLIGCGAAFNGPAWQSSVGEMVPREDLPAAVGLNSMGFNIARSVGPALGGAIVAAAGAAAAFAINAVSYFPLLLALRRWRPLRPKRTLPRERLPRAMAAGVRYAALSPNIKVVLSRALLFGFGASASSAMMPLIARDLIGGGALTFGLLLGSFGVGAVAGALASTTLRRSLGPEGIVLAGCLTFAAALGIAAWSRTLLLTMPALAAAGASWVLALSTFNVTIQLHSPRWVVARSLALYQMAAFGGMAGGAWTWGIIAEDNSVPTALVAAAMVIMACAAAGFWLRLPPGTAIDLDPLREWSPPDTAIDIRLRSGPVVITVEFRIGEEDIPMFLAAMQERRRIRRRDGARQWTLLRDTADPEIWIERFQVANWADYIRHNNRITREDEKVNSIPRRLHRGAEPPAVRRLLERPAAPPPDLDVEVPGLREPLTDPRRFG